MKFNVFTIVTWTLTLALSLIWPEKLPHWWLWWVWTAGPSFLLLNTYSIYRRIQGRRAG